MKQFILPPTDVSPKYHGLRSYLLTEQWKGNIFNPLYWCPHTPQILLKKWRVDILKFAKVTAVVEN